MTTDPASKIFEGRAARRPVGEGSADRMAAERITVALIPRASEDLQRLQELTGLSKTDIVNRAISLYEFIEAKHQADADVLVRDPKTGEVQLVRFL